MQYHSTLVPYGLILQLTIALVYSQVFKNNLYGIKIKAYGVNIAVQFSGPFYRELLLQSFNWMNSNIWFINLPADERNTLFEIGCVLSFVLLTSHHPQSIFLLLQNNSCFTHGLLCKIHEKRKSPDIWAEFSPKIFTREDSYSLFAVTPTMKRHSSVTFP